MNYRKRLASIKKTLDNLLLEAQDIVTLTPSLQNAIANLSQESQEEIIWFSRYTESDRSLKQFVLSRIREHNIRQDPKKLSEFEYLIGEAEKLPKNTSVTRRMFLWLRKKLAEFYRSPKYMLKKRDAILSLVHIVIVFFIIIHALISRNVVTNVKAMIEEAFNKLKNLKVVNASTIYDVMSAMFIKPIVYAFNEIISEPLLYAILAFNFYFLVDSIGGLVHMYNQYGTFYI